MIIRESKKLTLFARRLTSWRLSKKKMQKEMAAELDVPPRTYRAWEKGSRTPQKFAMAEIERRMEESK